MGIYAITGGSSGIGARTVEILEKKGHKVINIDMKDGDICVNLATKEGRQAAIDKLHELCPDGLDAMICNAGVSGECGNIPLIISLNYFGAVAIAEGAYDLLQKKGGCCVVTSSNTIAQGAARMDVVGLLNNQADEERILNLVKDADPKLGHTYYAATKYALARWARRMAASWGARGVRINTVAPGNVRTAMTAKLTPAHLAAVEALPVPINYGTDQALMDPVDISNAIAFLASPEAHGVNGVVMFVDGGTDALLNSEKVY
jgi:NAD(P)-dependent dehydrogenase (short-subunit alcohol dehydrogenase family)